MTDRDDQEVARDVAAALSKWKCAICGGPMYGTPFSESQPELKLMRCVRCDGTTPVVKEHPDGCFCTRCLR